MKSIKIDFENKKLLNQYCVRTDRVLQSARIAVHIWLKDWLLDETIGINYDYCWGNQLMMELDLRRAIQNVEGIDRITSLKLKKEKDNYNNFEYIADITVVINGQNFVITDTVIGY